eukprot:gnl/TRDRNA2_/TRDRNA2_175700_c1_seq3.p1 gnl/TRDRNA2_/TRDRNA2_175700_c1~~gnl/TRDRNA2_/TRDRNA2_175700_c1_seq3.p1  ORF type:complete len:593 (+),score=91.93 gnl/TRDRNA2_/TRDRNA2_175700_c1_seq3:223-2001(+)
MPTKALSKEQLTKASSQITPSLSRLPSFEDGSSSRRGPIHDHHLYEDDDEAVSKQLPLMTRIVRSLDAPHDRKYNDWKDHLIHTRLFVGIINLAIFLSAVQMGLEADFPEPEHKATWKVFEWIFAVLFAVEVVLKVSALKKEYFGDWANVFDAGVASLLVLDVALVRPLSQSGDTHFLQIFRLVRLLRMVKVLKMVPELFVILRGIIDSLSHMLWVFGLLLVVLYTFAVFCTEYLGRESAGFPAFSEDERDVLDVDFEHFNNFIFFGTVSRSMISLFNMLVFAEWNTIVRPVYEIHSLFVVVFFALIIVTSFGVLNVIIGVIVERTSESMNQVRESDLEAHRLRQMDTIQQLAPVMFQLDEDDDEMISRTEMEAARSNADLQELLKQVELPHGFTFSDLHQMLDHDGSHYVSKREFIIGMLRLIYCSDFQRNCLFEHSMGQIKAQMHRSHQDIFAEFQCFKRSVQEELDAWHRQLSARPDCSGRDIDKSSHLTKDDGRMSVASGLASDSADGKQPSLLRSGHMMSPVDVNVDTVGSVCGKDLTVPPLMDDYPDKQCFICTQPLDFNSHASASSLMSREDSGAGEQCGGIASI